MLSPETLGSYRRMSPSQRLRLTMDSSRSAWSALSEGIEQIVARRFLRLEQENDYRNRMIREALRRSEERHESD